MLPISIVSLASLSPLGKTPKETWQAYKSPEHCFSEKEGNLVAGMSKELKKEIEELRLSDIKFKALDDSVLFAIYASRRAVDRSEERRVGKEGRCRRAQNGDTTNV